MTLIWWNKFSTHVLEPVKNIVEMNSDVRNFSYAPCSEFLKAWQAFKHYNNHHFFCNTFQGHLMSYITEEFLLVISHINIQTCIHHKEYTFISRWTLHKVNTCYFSPRRKSTWVSKYCCVNFRLGENWHARTPCQFSPGHANTHVNFRPGENWQTHTYVDFHLGKKIGIISLC